MGKVIKLGITLFVVTRLGIDSALTLGAIEVKQVSVCFEVSIGGTLPFGQLQASTQVFELVEEVVHAYLEEIKFSGSSREWFQIVLHILAFAPRCQPSSKHVVAWWIRPI